MSFVVYLNPFDYETLKPHEDRGQARAVRSLFRRDERG